MRFARFFAGVLALALATAASADSLREKLREKIPESKRMLFVLNDDDEIKVGRAVTANLLGVAPLVKDDALQRYVNTVGRWVAAGSERPELPWHFGVIESADVNAFAAPGGFVLITRGLYASLSDESELAGVLGHEIAHVVERHQVELMRKGTLLEEGRKAIEKRLDENKDQLMSRLIGSGAELFARRLDQDAEFEADRQGVVLAARAGYGAYGLPAVLQKIASVAKTDDRVQLLYKTHPAPEDRLRKLDSVMGADFYKYERPNAGGKLYPLRAS
ncbi:MAG: M48 family metalloprotease [Sulfurifustis sp.]